MDKSLDEIVASSRPKATRRGTGRRGGANASRTQVLGHAAPSPTTRARAAAAAAPATARPVTAPSAEKIMVSNLPLDVNEAQVEELFQTTVGPLRKVNLTYDANGRSKGVAYVQFSRRGDGRKAYEQYNNRLIDGKRAMKIEVIVDPAALPAPPTLAARVAPSPANAPAATNGTQSARRTGPTRGRGRGRGGARKNERPAKTVEDLDAEMEDYTAHSGSAAATATAA